MDDVVLTWLLKATVEHCIVEHLLIVASCCVVQNLQTNKIIKQTINSFNDRVGIWYNIECIYTYSILQIKSNIISRKIITHLNSISLLEYIDESSLKGSNLFEFITDDEEALLESLDSNVYSSVKGIVFLSCAWHYSFFVWFIF